MKLTNAEEQIMKYLWELKKAYMKNILDQYPDPKPATTTVVTLLKRMIEKGYVSYNQHGNNREYYPLIRKTDYFSEHLNGLIKNFFNDSSSQFASFFATETKLNEKELHELKDIIEKQLEKKKR
ncbi:MAG: BlaI/MecI/CopY family transcriptional regulator [Tannerella sp.]|jgi:predicted transcriptional regulator|nr:BlaI/MecI/CopY family transcriptional regulator [Tannerella sp.]